MQEKSFAISQGEQSACLLLPFFAVRLHPKKRHNTPKLITSFSRGAGEDKPRLRRTFLAPLTSPALYFFLADAAMDSTTIPPPSCPPVYPPASPHLYSARALPGLPSPSRGGCRLGRRRRRWSLGPWEGERGVGGGSQRVAH